MKITDTRSDQASSPCIGIYSHINAIGDWQRCSKEYIKHTDLFWQLNNRFTGHKPKKFALWCWAGWTIDSSPEYQECRLSTMLEF